jgi:hypothetical protein
MHNIDAGENLVVSRLHSVRQSHSYDPTGEAYDADPAVRSPAAAEQCAVRCDKPITTSSRYKRMELFDQVHATLHDLLPGGPIDTKTAVVAFSDDVFFFFSLQFPRPIRRSESRQ